MLNIQHSLDNVSNIYGTIVFISFDKYPNVPLFRIGKNIFALFTKCQIIYSSDYVLPTLDCPTPAVPAVHNFRTPALCPPHKFEQNIFALSPAPFIFLVAEQLY